MQPRRFTPIRTFGIFVFISILSLAGIVAGYSIENIWLFWISIVAFVIFGIGRILIVLRALKSQNEHQTAHNIELTRERSKLLALVNSLGEAVFAIDQKGLITAYNAAALELIDSHAELIGQKISEVLPFKSSKNDANFIDSVLHEGKIVTRDDLEIDRADGKISLYAVITPVNEAGELVGAIILARDISRQKSLQQQKDEFLSVVSHELRTPVAIVEADLSTVLLPGYTVLDEKALKLLRSASQNLTYLSGLLQDISDLSHAERAVLDVELHSMDPTKLAKDLAEDFTLRAQKEQLELRFVPAESLPNLITSEQRVREILVNFFTNAIKYSAGVGKTVTFTVKPSEEFPGGVQFAVADEGLGMSEEEQAKLFSKFYRSSSEKVQAIKGTGMGLYITAQQAKKIGAKIHLSSETSKGSIFYLEVPPSVPQAKVATTQ